MILRDVLPGSRGTKVDKHQRNEQDGLACGMISPDRRGGPSESICRKPTLHYI